MRNKSIYAVYTAHVDIIVDVTFLCSKYIYQGCDQLDRAVAAEVLKVH